MLCPDCGGTLTAAEARAVANGWKVGAYRYALQQLAHPPAAVAVIPPAPSLTARVLAARGGSAPAVPQLAAPLAGDVVTRPRMAQSHTVPPPPSLTARVLANRAAAGAR